MRKILLTAVILALSINCISFAIDNNIQISDKDKKLYKLRQNQEYGMYAGDMSMYNKDYTDKADSFLQKGDIEKANKYIDLALYYYDRNPLSYVIKAEIDLKKNNINGTKDNYQKAIDIIESDLDKYNSTKCNSLWIRIDKGYIKIALQENDILTASDKIDVIRANWTHFDTEIISEVNWRDNTYLKPNKQYHCYIYSGNSMPYIFENTGLKWNDLYRELFSPQKIVLDYIESLKIIRSTFVSVHFRFVNALEHFENTFFDNHIDSESEKQDLIKRCHRAIFDIIADNPNQTQQYKNGKDKLFGFFVGQVMKATRGQANPSLTADIIREEIEKR